MAQWRKEAFVLFADAIIIGLRAKERRGAAEGNAHRQEDGDIEHTPKKYRKMTHSCEKILISVMRQQNSATWQKKTKSL